VLGSNRVDDLSLLVKTRQTKRKVVHENWEIIAGTGGESLLRAIIAKTPGQGDEDGPLRLWSILGAYFL
jgi:hypothetical protein